MSDDTDYLPTIVGDLSYSYRGAFTEDEVRAAVTAAHEALAPTAKVATYLPILVARHARELLVSQAQADGRIVKKVPEILFICVHNAGRSQMAAALTEHLSAGRVHVRSAGSQPTDAINPVVVQALAERGVNLSEAYPKPLTDSVVRAADVVITMGCGDTCPYYPGKLYQEWEVPDPAGQPLNVVRDIRDDLQARVTTLLRRLLD